ncbi:50S ribosomal protein L4 [Candidatus Uhrbacteria bacterium]|nr:50S ribosomal protein L4 [Candidatus Uhrbacteria bacterium]
MAATAEKMIVDVYNMEGEKVSTRELSPDVFGISVQDELLHFAVVVQAANERGTYAHTKTRGEVRGGGKKPWKQKGTGRARHGSIRSPIWRGGGIVFGPRTDRNYSMKINKKVKKKALCMALAQKAQTGKLILIDTFAPSNAKTKEAFALLKKLPLILTKKKSEKIAFLSPKNDSVSKKSFSNVSFVTVVPVENLNVIDLVKSTSIVAPLTSIDVIEKRYAKPVTSD